MMFVGWAVYTPTHGASKQHRNGFQMIYIDIYASANGGLCAYIYIIILQIYMHVYIYIYHGFHSNQTFMVLSPYLLVTVLQCITPITHLWLQKEPGIFISRFMRCRVKCLYNFSFTQTCAYVHVQYSGNEKRGNGKFPRKGWLGKTLSIKDYKGGFSIAMFDCQRVYCMLNINIYI